MREAAPARAPHVLYVAWGFPPHRGPGTYRPLASVNRLAADGVRVTVLTADEATFEVVVGADPSLTVLVDPRVRVVRVPMRHDMRDPVVNRWSPERARNPKVWTRARAEELAREFPEPVYAPWLRRAAAAARAVHDDDPVDLALVSANPYTDVAVALDLHAHDDVPFVVDDRDSWLLDVYTGAPRPDLDAVLPWFEAALDACREMWFVNPPIADWHRERFPHAAGRIRVVENGWDPRLLDVARLDALVAARTDRRPTATFVGTVSPDLPLAALAEGWRRARAAEPRLRDGVLRVVGQLGHSGHPTPEQRRVREEYADDGVVLEGRVAAARVVEVYAASDVLVFAKEGGGMVTSGKVYEYAATGLPVVAAVGEQHDARRVLAAHPRVAEADPTDADAVADALRAAFADAWAPDAAERRRAAAELGAHRRRDVVLAAAFDEVLAGLGSSALGDVGGEVGAR